MFEILVIITFAIGINLKVATPNIPKVGIRDSGLSPNKFIPITTSTMNKINKDSRIYLEQFNYLLICMISSYFFCRKFKIIKKIIFTTKYSYFFSSSIGSLIFFTIKIENLFEIFPKSFNLSRKFDQS